MSERAGTGFAIAAVLLALIVAVAAGFVRDFSGDFHWHVALGRWVLDHGQLYLVDHHSHTAAGDPYFASSWLADVLFAVAYAPWDYAGTYALRAAALVAVALFLMSDAIGRGVSEVAAATLVLFWFATCLFLLYLRPETLAFALLAALLWALGRIDRQGGRAPRVAVLALALVWPNLHGSVSIGLAAIGLASAEQVLRQLAAGAARDRGRLVWGLVLPPLAFALSCINPEGISLPLAIRIVSEIWVTTVTEWQPLPLSAWPPMAVAAALAVAVTTGAAVALGRAARLPWWNLALFAVLCAFTLRYQRFLAYALLAAVPMIAAASAEIAGAVGARPSVGQWRWIGRGVVAVAMAWAIASLVLDRRLHTQVGLGPDPQARVNPEGACQFITDADAPGPLFNTYVFGSFLMHCLGPRHPVFIDGRAWSLYEDQFYARFRRSGLSASELTRLLAEHPAAWAVVAYDPHAARFAAMPEAWRLLYFDDVALVYASVRHPATAGLAPVPAFTLLDPGRLVQLTDATGAALERARRELGRQEIRCRSCFRTDAAAAAVAIAAGDAAEFDRRKRRLLARGETPELAFLVARRAVATGDRAAATAMFQRFVALGGDPRVAQHYLGQPRR